MISDASDRGYRIIDLRSAGDGWNDAPSRAPSGVRVTPESALQCSTLLACCRLIAENCAQLPLRIMRRLPDGGKAKAKELPLYRILGQAPNPWQTSFEFRELLTFWATVYGNGFAEIRSGDRGSVDSLWPLHPSRMRVEQLSDGSLCYYYRETSGSETRYRQDQIFHLRWLSNDGITGMVPVTLSRDAIALAQALEVHGGTYFGNSCRLSGIMTSANPINTETAERLREQFERMHRGPDRAHRTAVLPAGVEWKDMSSTHTDAQFLEARAYQVLEICRAYRVDPSYVQSKEKVGYASQEQSAIDLVQQTLMPWFRRWESAIARDLISRDDIYYAQFDVASLLRGDLAAQSAWLREMVALGVYSINECRDILGMNPIPEGNQRYLQTNLTTLEGIAASAAKPEESPAPAPLPLPAPAGRDARHCGTGYGGFKGKNTCAVGHKGKNAYSDGKKPKAAPKDDGESGASDVAEPQPASGSIAKSGAAEIVPSTGGKRSALEKVRANATAAIDEVLSIPSAIEGRALPSVTLKKTASKTKAAYFRRDPPEIAINMGEDHPELSFCHEFGHYLDKFALTEEKDQPFLASIWGTTGRGNISPEMKDVLKALEETKSIRQVRAQKTLDAASAPYGISEDEKVYLKRSAAKVFADYVLQPHEQFARAFAQYISAKSSNEALRQQVRTLAEKTIPSEAPSPYVRIPLQWTDDDFKPVIDAMDKLFASKGMAKK